MFRTLFLIIGFLAGVVGHAFATEINEIRVEGAGEYTRITLAADGELAHGIFSLSDTGMRSIAVDLVDFRLDETASTPPPAGAVTTYEISSRGIAFHLSHAVTVSRALNIGPTVSDPRHRLVIDLVRVSPDRFDRDAAIDVDRRAAFGGGQVPEAGETAVASLPPARQVIVIDPGHGGHDPGALAADKTREKDVVLKTALYLKAALETSGRYTVHLTREGDTYIEHEDRVTMARNWGADLFISIHADAAANRSVSGATVYTLNSRGQNRVDPMANKYGWHLPVEDGTSNEVASILTDLTKRETKTNSSIFAEILIPELASAGPIVRNSHRQENFFVLLAPDVPAVLIEIGFLTNRTDAARLASAEGRERSAKAIARAIDAYFDRSAAHTAVN